MTAPMVRGTARKLGLRLPPSVYYAPLREQPWPGTFFDHAALAGAITTGMVSAAEASHSAAEYFAALRKQGRTP